MSKPLSPEENPLPTSEPGIQIQVENITVDGGIQALMGNNNIQFQGDSNVVTFNKTEILQISVEEIKTRKFIETSPYKGLKKFEPADKDLFFGRDQFLKGLINELEQTNLILLLGASGSGKSSVVQAGLIPWLSQKWGSRLVNLTFTPDNDPFENFYARLLNKYKQMEVQIAREAKANTLAQVVERLKQPDDYWFILIDQFEELFTTSLADKCEQFIKSLVKLSKTKQSTVKIMGTMRADFLDRLSPYPQLVKATDKHRPFIAEMQLDELRLAIEQPAAHHGVVFETGLVEEMIKDIQGQAGYLPLLQYTLNLLWETEVETGNIRDRTLNTSTYRQLGGVRGALQQHVDYIYDTLPEVEKLATRRIFLKLVDIGEDSEVDSEWKPVRKRAFRSEFSDELEQTVLMRLINENLLVSDRQPQSQESTVEITHEILLTSWTTFNTWIEENRHAIALRNRLNDDVANWQAKKTDDELWSGSKLEKVVELRKDSTFNQVLGGFSDAANQFIDASVGLRDRQRRRTIIGLTGFSVVALILAGAAGLGWWFTEFQRQQTITGLTTASQELFDSNKEFDALLASLNAGKQAKQAAFGVNSDMQFQVKVALQQAISGVKERNRLEGHKKAPVYSVSYSPDGKTLASASGDKTVKLWDVATGKEISTLNHKNAVAVVSFSPDGKTLASASGDKTVKLWDVATGKEIFTFSGYEVSYGDNG
ncbi:NACHT and WD repeat domain-containing protein, partial [Nostoc sp.]